MFIAVFVYLMFSQQDIWMIYTCSTLQIQSGQICPWYLAAFCLLLDGVMDLQLQIRNCLCTLAMGAGIASTWVSAVCICHHTFYDEICDLHSFRNASGPFYFRTWQSHLDSNDRSNDWKPPFTERMAWIHCSCWSPVRFRRVWRTGVQWPRKHLLWGEGKTHQYPLNLFLSSLLLPSHHFNYTVYTILGNINLFRPPKSLLMCF